MNNKEEAEKAWVEKSHHLSNDEAWAYCAGISDFKAALIQAVEKEIDDNIPDCDYTEGKEVVYKHVIDLINETKPL